MQYRKLGRSGLSVSALCLGMMSYGSPRWQRWVLEDRECRRFVGQASDAEIIFFDIADFYSLGASEQAIGQAISGLCRHQGMVISTKVWVPIDQSSNGRGLSRKPILQSVDASLERFGTHYIDLYELHAGDSLTPVEETVDALTDLVRGDKILCFGVSNSMPWQLAAAQHAALIRSGRGFGPMRTRYNMLYREE